MHLKSWVVWPFLILKKFAVIFSVMGLLMALINEIVVKSNTFCCRKPEHNQFHSSDVCQALAYCGDVIEHNRYCWNNLQLSVSNNISASAFGKCMDGKSLQIWFSLTTHDDKINTIFHGTPSVSWYSFSTTHRWNTHKVYLLRKPWSKSNVRVPTRTGKPGKPGKMGRHFPVREKSGNFEQTGKVRENHTKYWKIQGISKTNTFCYFLVIFKWTVHYLLIWIKFSVKKNTGKMEKILEKSGNFVSPEKWEPCILLN